MIFRFCTAFAVCLLFCVSAAFAGQVKGRIALQESAGEAVFPSRYGTEELPQEQTGSGEEAVVYLVPLDQSSAVPPSHPASLIQRNLEFVPDILPVQKGTSVEFVNEDDEYHNILSYSKTKRFDLGRYRKEDPPPVVEFDQEGVVKIYCEIHKHMRGVILVLDTPYFKTVTSEGSFVLENIPPGRYRAEVWAKRGKFKPQEITVGADPLEIEFAPV